MIFLGLPWKYCKINVSLQLTDTFLCQPQKDGHLQFWIINHQPSINQQHKEATGGLKWSLLRSSDCHSNKNRLHQKRGAFFKVNRKKMCNLAWRILISSFISLMQVLQSAKQPRSSHLQVFCKKRVLKNFEKLTGKHLCQSLFFSGLQLY